MVFIKIANRGEKRKPPATYKIIIGKKMLKLLIPYNKIKNIAASKGLEGAYCKIVSAEISEPQNK